MQETNLYWPYVVAMIGDMTTYKTGDPFDIQDLNTGDDDCPSAAPGGLPFCNLTKDHEGQHVAADLDMKVVAVWQ